MKEWGDSVRAPTLFSLAEKEETYEYDNIKRIYFI